MTKIAVLNPSNAPSTPTGQLLLSDVEQFLKSYIQYSGPFLHYDHPLRLRNPGLVLTFLLFEVIYFYLSCLRQLFHFTDRCYVTLKLSWASFIL